MRRWLGSAGSPGPNEFGRSSYEDDEDAEAALDSSGSSVDSDLDSSARSSSSFGSEVVRPKSTWRRVAAATSQAEGSRGEVFQERWHDGVVVPSIVLGSKLMVGYSIVYVLYFEAARMLALFAECDQQVLDKLADGSDGFISPTKRWWTWLLWAGSVLSLTFCAFRPWRLLYVLSIFVSLSTWAFVRLSYPEQMKKQCFQTLGMRNCEFPRDSHWMTQCGPVGFAVLADTMMWMWMLPFVLLEKSWLKLMLAAWMLGYFVACFQDSRSAVGQQKIQINSDMLAGGLFAAALALLALRRKEQMQLAQRVKFKLDLEQAAATQQLYTLLRFMVPAFVISPMLKYPAKSLEMPRIHRASIMFVKIVGFDELARSLPPEQILAFLNRSFTEFDCVCKEQDVTKIETFKEEYLCAVGVAPGDLEVDRSSGHRAILGKLILASLDILAMELDLGAPVEVKVGIHTGPVIAGVVGEKLPRFRLFGDTVNTAARMMQQGLPAAVQFGEPTFRELPDWAASRAECRGQVEMKGKGQLTTYLLRGQGDNQATSTSRSRPLLHQRLLHSPSISEVIVNTDRLSTSHTHSAYVSSQSEFQSVLQEMEDYTMCQSALCRDETLGAPPSSVGNLASCVSCCGICGWKDFPREAEQEFQDWFHQQETCRDVITRLGNHTACLALLTAVEVLYLLFGSDTSADAGVWPALAQLWTFLACRALCCLLLLAAREVKKSRRLRVLGTMVHQRLFFACCFTVTTLLFISYDSLRLPLWTIEPLPPREQDIPAAGVATNVSFLAFFFVYMLAVTAYSFPFTLSLGFPIITAILVWFVNGFFAPFLGNLPLNSAGHWLIMWACMVATEARFKEGLLRGQYKASWAADLTHRRIRGTLDALMPPQVVSELHPSAPVVSHSYGSATLVQSDLCGFTRLASALEPGEVVAFIAEIFGRFDRLADVYQVYKVETVGDAYIAGQGGPPLTETASPTAVLRFAIHMVEVMREFSRERGQDVGIRVGVHTSPCVGGIVGTDMQRYHLFGELMTSLEVLESTSHVGRVHASRVCRDAADAETQSGSGRSPILCFEERAEPSLVTSKGEVHAYSDVGGRPTFFVSE